jgi:catechol 2,3-dioxygenase-like lactoylglutathione lyase family enzyme
MAPTLALFVLRCADLEASARFYRALGLRLQPERHGTGPAHYSCALEGIVLELYPEQGKTTATRLGFDVDDPLTSAQYALQTLGLAPDRATVGPESVSICDPDGNVVVLTCLARGGLVSEAHYLRAKHNPSSAPPSDLYTAARKTRLANEVAAAWGDLVVALESKPRRRWPANEFRRFRDAVHIYAHACSGDDMIHRTSPAASLDVASS